MLYGTRIYDDKSNRAMLFLSKSNMKEKVDSDEQNKTINEMKVITI